AGLPPAWTLARPLAPIEAWSAAYRPTKRTALLITPRLSNLCSKAWIWRQYDRSVRTNTVIGLPGDAAVHCA
ncbi:MAG: hypothetical protein IPN03_17290, partial [Holophagales bacterium]|nr:hypothetical protein [Holophagales bacterium]